MQIEEYFKEYINYSYLENLHFVTEIKDKSIDYLIEYYLNEMYIACYICKYDVTCNYYRLIIDKIRRLLDLTNNYIEYNKYYDMVKVVHKRNLKRDIDNTTKTKKSTKPKYKNIYTRAETKDMFTGKTQYIYENLATEDRFFSENPDLLGELNAKPKKIKAPKVLNISFDINMFNK